MFIFNKSKKTLNIIIEDYILRIIEINGNELTSIKMSSERILPEGLIENGRIQDEIGFYEFMKTLVKELNLKNRQVRFNVPHALIIMRQVEVPTSLKDKNEILHYIEIEIGKSIHLPFQNAIIDLPETTEELLDIGNETRIVTFFAAPGEELRKFTEVLVDAGLKPISADVGILASYRYIHETQSLEENHVYLVLEFNLKSIYLGIFNANRIEFIRYQDLDLNINRTLVDEETGQTDLQYKEDEITVNGLIEDQINELERIMNFYRFSIHKGDEMVTDIVLLGDNPKLNEIYHMMKNRYEGVSVLQLREHETNKPGQSVDVAFLPALGLALRGG